MRTSNAPQSEALAGPSAEQADRVYQSMCAKGTSAFTPDEWRAMARTLHDVARAAPLGFQSKYVDRAKDCSYRAVRAAYAGSVGAGFRSEVSS